MEKKKYLYIDFIRVFSMLSVIILHVVADIMRIDYLRPVWHFSNVISTLCSSAVPLFFMISGALLLSNDKSSSIKLLYKERLKKVLVPFLFWSLFAILYLFIVGLTFYGKINLTGVEYRLINLMAKPIMIHFWFMYALIPIYVLLPFIKAFVDMKSTKLISYFFVIWLVFSVAFPTLQCFLTDDYKTIVQMDLNYNLNIFNGYLGFFVLGYYLHNLKFKIKKRWLMLFIILEVTGVSLATYIGTKMTGAYFENFKVYSGIFTASLSVALFLLFKELFGDNETIKGEKILTSISSASFSVYLTHNILIHFMNINYILVPDGTILRVIVRVMVVFAVCYILYLALSRIKPLAFITTGNKYKGLKNKCGK